ncbi:MAG: MMPL family transporter [Gammaproteobacteria bacterium]|nr:MMPL family transporter [Gammaproteobacteria bacterium]MDP2347986.1 MMPL family transporter [Gammaproteobacteria bacterium]
MKILAAFLIHRRPLLLAASLLATFVLALGIMRAEFDTSLSVLMTRSDPYLEQLDRMSAEFPVPEEISFAFVPHNGEVFSHPTLLALADLQREFRQIPLALSMSSVLAWQSPFGDDTLFERPLTQLDSYSAEELAELREEGLADPFVVGALLSPGTDLAIASIRLQVTALNDEQGREAAQVSMALRDSLQARHPDVAIHVSSEALFEHSNRSAMISDLTLLLPIVLLLCTAIVCYSFRSLLLGVSILIVGLITVVVTVGTLGWMGQSFNTISVMAPLVVVTIALADSVHIVSIFRQRLLAGASCVEAMQHSLTFNIRPVTLATITTVIGFASLNLASSPAISTFGSVVALGVFYAWVLTLLALPALVLMVSGRLSASGAMSLPLTSRITKWCGQLIGTSGKPLLWSVTALAIVALGLSFLNRTDFDRMAFIGEDSPVHGYVAVVSEKMQRGPQLTYGVQVTQEFGAIEPEFLRQLDGFANWLRAQDEVVSVASLVEVVKTVNQVMNENRAEDYLVPDDVLTVEDHLFSYQQVQARNYQLDILASDDFSLLTLFVVTHAMSNQQIIDLDTRISTEFARQMPGAELLHGSPVLVFARMDRAVTIELLQGYGFSLLFITLTLIVGMRSLRYGLLSMLPNLLPAVFVFGAWGLFVGQIDPFVMMLFSISIGLVVDDTVHVLSSYQTSLAEGRTAREAVDMALAKAGPALMITTTVMALGTCVLIGASTLFFQQAATLLVPIVVLALVLDLTFFPALLLQMDRASQTL